MEVLAAAEAEALAAVEASAAEDRRAALAEARVRADLAARIVPLTIITHTDISGAHVGVGAGDRAGAALIGAEALAEPLYF